MLTVHLQSQSVRHASLVFVVTSEIMDRMLEAGITSVKIKCQDAVGYLAVYRYITVRLQISSTQPRTSTRF